MKRKIIYHIMIDRFAGYDPKRTGRCFKGGNLQGIIDHLDYIQSLGCNGILLTPFYKTNEYHGYHILDYEQVDEHFGTWADVKQLIEVVHHRGMTITADFVANHCHINNHIVKEHPKWFKRRKDGSSIYFAKIDYLPQFDLSKEEPQRYMIEKGLRLCELGFDAIRLDFAKGPSLKFWKRFREDIKKEYPNVLLIGEVWGTPIGKHLPTQLAEKIEHGEISKQEAWQMNYIGIFDGVLDFEYQSLLCNAVRHNQGIVNNKQLKENIDKHFEHYASAPNYNLWLFLDNHDTNRFLYECGGDVGLVKEAINLSLSFHRPYILYYGTEKGMAHKDNRFSEKSYADEQVRECMKWNYKSFLKI